MKTKGALLEAVIEYQGGNTSAFSLIYEESYKYLHTCVIHVVKTEEVAQDMLQETYMEIVKSISQLRMPEDFLSWAAMIANRKCFAYLKKDRDILVDDNMDDEGNTKDFFEEIADDEALIPEEVLQDAEKVRLMREIIDNLTDMQRLCVIGFYYNEQKQEEIAAELGVPVNTVKSHLNRAKAKIKESVIDLDRKQGTRLYAIAPFMLLFFKREMDVYAAEISVPAMSVQLVNTVENGADFLSKSSSLVHASASGAKTIAGVSTKVLLGIGAATTVAAVAAVAIIGKNTIWNTAKTDSMQSAEEVYEEDAVTEEELNESEQLEEQTDDTMKEAEADTSNDVLELEELEKMDSSKFDWFDEARQGIIIAWKDGKVGAIDYMGNELVPMEYVGVRGRITDDGQFSLLDENYISHVFDRNGTELCALDGWVEAIGEDVILYYKDGMFYYCSLNGETLFQTGEGFYWELAGGRYFDARAVGFSEGIAFFNDFGCRMALDLNGNATMISDPTVYEDSRDTEDDDSSGVNLAGVSSRVFFDMPFSPCTDGYYLSNEYDFDKCEDYYHMFDRNGTEIASFFLTDFVDVQPEDSINLMPYYRDGMARYNVGTTICIGYSNDETSRSVVVDLSKGMGKDAIVASAEYIGFSDETYWIVQDGEKCSYIDHSGNEVSTSFMDGGAFSDGMAVVCDGEDNWYIMNEDFEKISEDIKALSVWKIGDVIEVWEEEETSYYVLQNIIN